MGSVKVGGVLKDAAVLVYDAGFHCVSKVLDVFIRAPLIALYWHGPPLGGYGFWHGTPAADVCAALTRMPASFWESSLDAVTECAILRERHFTSFYVVVSVSVYVCVAYQLLQFALFRMCVLRPLMMKRRAAQMVNTTTLLEDTLLEDKLLLPADRLPLEDVVRGYYRGGGRSKRCRRG